MNKTYKIMIMTIAEDYHPTPTGTLTLDNQDTTTSDTNHGCPSFLPNFLCKLFGVISNPNQDYIALSRDFMYSQHFPS